jgi:hypothetical protein
MIRWVPADPPYHDAVRGLLTKAAELLIEGDSTGFTEDLLREGAVREASTWNLPGPDAASWIAREARYLIARTVAIAPRSRDDPMIDLVIEVLAWHPVQVQARILRAAALHVRGSCRSVAALRR